MIKFFTYFKWPPAFSNPFKEIRFRWHLYQHSKYCDKVVDDIFAYKHVLHIYDKKQSIIWGVDVPIHLFKERLKEIIKRSPFQKSLRRKKHL